MDFCGGIHATFLLFSDESMEQQRPRSLRPDKLRESEGERFDSALEATPQTRAFIARKLAESFDK